MINGPERIVACPHCGVLVKYGTIASGNTFDAQSWTDGKTVYPMMPFTPSVTKCYACKDFYWLNQVKKIGTFDKLRDKTEPVDESWIAAKDIEEPSAAQYYEAIDRGFAKTKKQEISLRWLAWERRNDAFRYNLSDQKDNDVQIVDSGIKNIDELQQLLINTKDDRVKIIRAELNRHLGRFDEAKKILNAIKSKKLSWIVSVLNALCSDGIRELRNLNDPFNKGT